MASDAAHDTENKYDLVRRIQRQVYASDVIQEVYIEAIGLGGRALR